MSIRDTILAAPDRPLQPLDMTAEWGVTVFVAMLSLTEITDAKDQPLTDLALLTLRDDQGVVIFTADDLPSLKGKSYKAVNKVLEAFIEVNGFSKDAVKDAAKN
jgi:hypothetical protein